MRSFTLMQSSFLLVLFAISFLSLSVTVQSIAARDQNWPAIPLGDLYDNCETLSNNEFNIWWSLDKKSGKLWFAAESSVDSSNYYAAFGISGNPSSVQMNGGDVIMTDFYGNEARARDYFLQDMVGCMEKYQNGVCPDSVFDVGSGKGKDDIGRVFGAEYEKDSKFVRVVHFSRDADTHEEKTDKKFDISGSPQLIIWAIGTVRVDGSPGRHSSVSRKNLFIDFARAPAKNCRSLLNENTMKNSIHLKSEPDGPAEPVPTIASAAAAASSPQPAHFHSVTSARPTPSPTPFHIDNTYPPLPNDVLASAPVAVAGTTRSSSIVQPWEKPNGPAVVANRGEQDASVVVDPRAPGLSTLSNQLLGKGWQPMSFTDQRIVAISLGPSGGAIGFSSLTGKVAPRVCFYVQPKPGGGERKPMAPIPELVVYRGTTYTFLIETGHNVSENMFYQPVYITDDPEGGRDIRPLSDISSYHTFAGPSKGRLCLWTSNVQESSVPDSFPSFAASLVQGCDPGQSTRLVWTPDNSTPDVVYYQSTNQVGIGAKITVKSR